MADKAGWTDGEKCALAVAILNAQGGSVPWAKVKPPAGRTTKACMHVWAKMKAAAEEHTGVATTVETDGDGNAAVPSTPKKPAARGRKRKAADEGTEESPATPKTPKTPRTKKAKKEETAKEEEEVKQEESGEGDEEA